MSGSSIPYHLRTNKAVDRQIFFDLLKRLKLDSEISSYKYISLGGPMLEDHQLLHGLFGMVQLYSLESDSAAFSRQKFNKPYQCIECLNTDTSTFITDFEESDPVIVWLDYTNTKWSRQFNECKDLISKLKVGDILKVTFNANPDALKGDTDLERLESFKKKASGDFLSDNITENSIKTMRGMASVLQEMFAEATESALLVDDLIFSPMTSFRYIDNRHHMLTVTGMVVDNEADFNELKAASELDDWEHLVNDWDVINEINIPDLTARERFKINEFLPCEGIDVSELPFKLHSADGQGQKIIDNYIKYYRYVPYYHKSAY